MTIEIELDKGGSIPLEMQIDGDASGTPVMRFSIIAENFSVSVNAERIDNGVYEVNIPKLKGVLPAGQYKVVADVFIGDQYLPAVLEDKITLKGPPTASVKLAESVRKPTPKTPEVKVSVTKVEEKVGPVLTKTDQIITI
jgi:hypothetical protein